MSHFIQLPPDSTGKKVRHEVRTDLYLTFPETNVPNLGILVYGSISGASGTLVGRAIDNNEVEYFLNDVIGNFQVNDVISSAPAGAGTVYSTVLSAHNNIYTSSTVISDANNPDNIMAVNQYGAASVTFAEGEPSLDAFGQLRISNAYPIGVYDHSNASMDDLMTIIEVNGGNNAHSISTASSMLTVTSNTSSYVSRTTNRYHYYTPGAGNFIIQTIACGDTGKANNTRRWGYYDDNDGVYWELDANGLNAVIRSSTSGSVVNNKVNISNFNVDKLDGDGSSGFTLDVTKANFYWIDFAWLGVGVVRFGVLTSDGARLVAHTFKNPNNNIHPYMQSGSLPLRWENFNSGVVISGSELRNICSSVYAQSQPEYTFWRYSDIGATKTAITPNTVLYSLRSKSSYNGRINRITAYPEEISFYITGGDIKYDLVWADDLVNDTWAISGNGSVEGDANATAISSGRIMYSGYLGTGSHNIDIAKFFELNDEAICRTADNTDSYILSIVVSNLTANSTNVTSLMSYRELR